MKEPLIIYNQWFLILATTLIVTVYFFHIQNWLVFYFGLAYVTGTANLFALRRYKVPKVDFPKYESCETHGLFLYQGEEGKYCYSCKLQGVVV